tara:strand:- start:4882 stop:5226 length:345 start_codon:yes stop_codon:yes gene_type:complete
MKKLLVVLLIIVGQFLCPSVQAQESIKLESLILETPTTFVSDGGIFIGDVLYLNGQRVILQAGAVVRFERVVGPGKIYLYPTAILGIAEDLPADVEVYIVKPERPVAPSRWQKG